MTAATTAIPAAEHWEHPAMRPNAPVSLDDVTEAARILLRRHQDNLTVNWRDERWFDDDELTARVAKERSRWRPGARWPTAALFDDLWAQEVLLAGLAPASAPRAAYGPDGIAPLFVISSLDQLGVRARTAFDEDYRVGCTLLDRPEWFDPIRLGGIPVAEVPYLRDVFGTTRLDLLLRLGWGYDALLAATDAPDALDIQSLRTLVALRHGT